MRALLAALIASLLFPCASAVAADAHARFDGVWLVRRAPVELTTTQGKPPPLLPAARAEYEAQRARRDKGDTSFDHTSWCASAGFPRLMFEPRPFEIMVNARQIAFLYEWNRWARLVDMTGNDLQPYYPLSFGTANGRWEGDVLVVVTRQTTKETFLDRTGLPHSEDIVLTERLRLVSGSVLENRIRIEDPATYSEPWEVIVSYARQRGKLAEDVCLDRLKQGIPAI